MAPIPVPIINAPQTPTPSLPSFSTPLPGEEGGFCGLTGEQWRLVVLLVVVPLCLVLAIVLFISWFNEKDISLQWPGVLERAEMARTELREKLFGHLLSENDVRIITPGADITPRRYPLVDFLIPLLFRVQRGPDPPEGSEQAR